MAPIISVIRPGDVATRRAGVTLTDQQRDKRERAGGTKRRKEEAELGAGGESGAQAQKNRHRAGFDEGIRCPVHGKSGLPLSA